MRVLEQLRRSRYVFFSIAANSQAGMKQDNWRGVVGALHGSGKTHTSTGESLGTGVHIM